MKFYLKNYINLLIFISLTINTIILIDFYAIFYNKNHILSINLIN